MPKAKKNKKAKKKWTGRGEEEEEEEEGDSCTQLQIELCGAVSSTVTLSDLLKTQRFPNDFAGAPYKEPWRSPPLMEWSGSYSDSPRCQEPQSDRG